MSGRCIALVGAIVDAGELVAGEQCLNHATNGRLCFGHWIVARRRRLRARALWAWLHRGRARRP